MDLWKTKLNKTYNSPKFLFFINQIRSKFSFQDYEDHNQRQNQPTQKTYNNIIIYI